MQIKTIVIIIAFLAVPVLGLCLLNVRIVPTPRNDIPAAAPAPVQEKTKSRRLELSAEEERDAQLQVKQMLLAAEKRPENLRKRESEEGVKRFEAQLDGMLRDSLIYSVDLSLHEVRIDPAKWGVLPLETKRNLVESFSTYFNFKGHSIYMDILSSRNDQKLATFSWRGTQIFE